MLPPTKIRCFNEISSPFFRARNLTLGFALCTSRNEWKITSGFEAANQQPAAAGQPRGIVDIDGIWRRQFFSVSISSKDVVVQKIQEIEISSAFQTACIFGDRRPYRRRASRIWRNAGLERLPPRWVLFD